MNDIQADTLVTILRDLYEQHRHLTAQVGRVADALERANGQTVVLEDGFELSAGERNYRDTMAAVQDVLSRSCNG